MDRLDLAGIRACRAGSRPTALPFSAFWLVAHSMDRRRVLDPGRNALLPLDVALHRLSLLHGAASGDSL